MTNQKNYNSFANLYFQALKYSSKSHPGGDHRHEKMLESSDVTPPSKMLRRSDSPENKHIESTVHGRTKAVYTHRARDRDGGKGNSLLNMAWVSNKKLLCISDIDFRCYLSCHL